MKPGRFSAGARAACCDGRVRDDALERRAPLRRGPEERVDQRTAGRRRQSTVPSMRSSIGSPLHVDDAAEEERADRHRDDRVRHQHLPDAAAQEREHVAGVDQRASSTTSAIGKSDQHGGRRAPRRGQRAHLAAVLLALADGVGDGLEDAGERAADLALDLHRRGDVEQVVRAEPLAHRDERLLERPAEPRLGEHAAQLGADRRARPRPRCPAATPSGRGRRAASRRSC